MEPGLRHGHRLLGSCSSHPRPGESVYDIGKMTKSVIPKPYLGRLFFSIPVKYIFVVEVLISIQKHRSNGSLHREFGCSAGGPGFDSRLRRIVEDVDGPGQAPT